MGPEDIPVPLIEIDALTAMSALADSAGIGFADLPLEHRALFASALQPVGVNHLARELFEGVPESVVVEHFSELLLESAHLGSDELCSEMARMVAEKDDSRTFEWVCKSPSGRTRDVRVILTRRESSPQRILCSLIDITDQRRAEYEANIYRHQLEEMFESRAGQVESAYETMWRGMDIVSRMVEARDRYTAGHMKRVSQLGAKIAEALGLDRELVEDIRLAGAVHDLGKIGIPAEILNKPTELTAAEKALLQDHVSVGVDLLQSAQMKPSVIDIVRQHHEREDGSGYPARLRRDVTCQGSKVLAVADTVESMCADRPQRNAAGINAAVDELVSGKGRLYEPRVVDAMLQLIAEDFAFDLG